MILLLISQRRGGLFYDALAPTLESLNNDMEGEEGRSKVLGKINAPDNDDDEEEEGEEEEEVAEEGEEEGDHVLEHARRNGNALPPKNIEFISFLECGYNLIKLFYISCFLRPVKCVVMQGVSFPLKIKVYGKRKLMQFISCGISSHSLQACHHQGVKNIAPGARTRGGGRKGALLEIINLAPATQ